MSLHDVHVAITFRGSKYGGTVRITPNFDDENAANQIADVVRDTMLTALGRRPILQEITEEAP